MNLYERFGDPCPVENCDGHLVVKVIGEIKSENGLARIKRERITECDNPQCPYYHAEDVPDELLTLRQPQAIGLSFVEDGR